MEELCLYLKPNMPCLDAIQNLRSRYDPLAAKVPPHVTLVFPFKVKTSDNLIEHFQNCLADVATIEFTTAHPELTADQIWIPFEQGHKEIILLHDKLYSGAMKQFLSPSHPYQPHITIGRFYSPENGLAIKRDAGS